MRAWSEEESNNKAGSGVGQRKKKPSLLALKGGKTENRELPTDSGGKHGAKAGIDRNRASEKRGEKKG